MEYYAQKLFDYRVWFQYKNKIEQAISNAFGELAQEERNIKNKSDLLYILPQI